MVFESIVTDVLNKVLGEYVENLDRKQLKIGIWGGDVVLQNLKLRDNALDELDLPVECVYGYLGKLVLKIPWKNLYSQPVIAQIEDLFVLVTPKQEVKYDAEKEAKYDLQTKQAALQKIVDAVPQEPNKDQSKPDQSFAEKLTAQIINNLQIKIAGVHIRFEDKATTSKPFAFGITLNNLEMYTTDSNWEDSYLEEQTSRVFKIASLDSLSIYMNCNAKLLLQLTQDELKASLQRNIAKKDYIPEAYYYIIGPISSKAKLQLNMNPEYDSPPFVIPKIDLNLEMRKLNISLTNTQFQDILKLADSLNRMQLGLPYRKFRPHNISYKGHYKEWWQFAINSVLHDVKRKNIYWEKIKEHRKLCDMYAEAYKERQLNKKAPAKVIETCNTCEQKLDLFNLILIRKRVQLEVEKINKEAQITRESKSWMSWWSGKKTDDELDQNNIVKKFQAAMTAEEKDKLYKAIGYEENAGELALPDHYEAVRVHFKLIALEIGLFDDSKVRQSDISLQEYDPMAIVILLNFSLVNCDLVQRPGSNGLSVTAGMKEMTLKGLKTATTQPTIIESKITHESNFLEIFFELNPLDKKCDQRIKAHARPLQFIYDSDTILEIVKLFTPATSVNLSELETAASAKISNFKERSATGIQYIVDTHVNFEIDITLMPNIVIIPYKGIYNPEQGSLIVISLGQLHFNSDPRMSDINRVQELSAAGHGREDILREIMEHSYDKFKLSIENVQMLVSKPKEKWFDALGYSTFSEMHVLQPTSIIMSASMCIIDDDPRLPKTKIEILIPMIHLSLTEDRIFEALDVVTSIPLPQNSEPETASLHKTESKLSLTNFVSQEAMKMRSAGAKRGEQLSTEIIQYTNLELNFVLKEIKVLMNKSRNADGGGRYDDTPSEKFGTPTDDLPPHDLNEDVSSLLTAIAAPESEKILTLQILKLEAVMVQRTYELVIATKLGAINLMQYDNFESKQQVVQVINTPRFSKHEQYLLSASYTMANKRSPEFITKYSSTEQLIIVNFSTLELILHQELLLKLLEIANGLQRKFEAVNKTSEVRERFVSTGNEGVVSKLQTILEDSVQPDLKVSQGTTPKRHKSKRDTRLVDSIKLKVVANLEQFGVQLACRKRSLATLKVDRLSAGIIIKSSYTEITTQLKDIVVVDMNPVTIHTTIMAIFGTNAFNSKIVLYNLPETSNYNSDDMMIDVEIGCMRIVFLNWFVTSVLNFLNNFQAAQQALANAGAAAADAARQNVVEAYEKATRMKLSIKMKAPIIVVPIDSESVYGIALDLGFLDVTNTITSVSSARHSTAAVIDEIKLELKNVKCSKISVIVDEEELSSEDATDCSYGLKSKMNIMNPISFTLTVKRNLSFSWYKKVPEIDLSGHLQIVEFNLLADDYCLIMSILNRNLNEGQDEFPQIQTFDVKRPEIHSRVRSRLSSTSDTAANWLLKKTELEAEKKTIYEQLKFNFQLDGVMANLKLNQDEGLARFGIYYLSLKGNKLMDGTLSASIVLCDMHIDDVRPNLKSKITRYLHCKEWKTKDKKSPEKSHGIVHEKYMIDVTAIIKENDTFAEIRVCGFDLIISVDFLNTLAHFFVVSTKENDPRTKTLDEIRTDAIYSQQQKRLVAANTSVVPETKINLILYIEEPEIILTESLNDIDSKAIIFNAQAKLNYRQINEKQIISGQIEPLKMYMCSFKPEKRDATKHYIIHPCVISLQGSTPDQEGLHINLKMSDIIINISPATIELINKVLMVMTTKACDEINNIFKKEDDHSDIWKPITFIEKDFWFLKAEQGIEALDLTDLTEIAANSLMSFRKTEKCIVEIPSIALVIETGIGYYTTPLLYMETKLNATVSDWSRNLNITGSLNLSMNYYNQTLAVWEPLIEPNETLNNSGMSEFLPWELNFNLSIESKDMDLEDEESVQHSVTKIEIHSKEILEITLSKTCLNNLILLGEAFSQAIEKEGMIKPDVIAPYVIENDTGFDIKLNFKRGIFTLHECHFSCDRNLNRSIIFEHPQCARIAACAATVTECKLSPSAKAYLQTKDLSQITSEEDEEYNIFVKIDKIDKEISLPVSKSDQRYFPLYRDVNQEPWGILSQVRSEYGTTKINIHGVVNIHNHFATNILVYRNKPNSTQKIEVGKVAAGKIFHVPLHSIYADSKELFFSLPGYQISVQGIKWNDSPTDLLYHRQIQCDPIDTFEPLYINAIREKTEVYHENTTKYKLLSAFYTIHLRPPLYLMNALPIEIKVSVAGCSVRHSVNSAVDKAEEVDKNLAHQKSKEDILDYGEKIVEPGDVLHLPTVKFNEKYKESKSYIVIRLIQYLEKDWSCTTEINDKHEGYATWTFSSYDSEAKMDMDMSVRFENRNGSVMLTLYSPFWMINKTGLMISYKTNIESIGVLYHPPEYNGPILFSFREKALFNKKSAAIRIDNGEWSDKIPLDVAGAVGEVLCKANKMSYRVGVHNHLTYNSLTKKITFIPFYTLTNRCSFPIEVQELSRQSEPWIKLEVNECKGFWPYNCEDVELIAKIDEQKTAVFSVNEAQLFLLKLENSPYGGVDVDVQVTEGGTYVIFTQYQPGDAPGLIINHSSQTISFCEKGTNGEMILDPFEKILFAWSQPTTSDNILIIGNMKLETDLKRDAVGELKLTEYSYPVYWVSFLNGLQRCLLFTESDTIATNAECSSYLQHLNQEILLRIHGIGFSIFNNSNGVDVLYLGITSSGVIWETRKLHKRRFKQMNIADTHVTEELYQEYLRDEAVNETRKYILDSKYEIDFANMSINKNGPRDIRRTFYPGVWMQLKTSPYQSQIHIKINRIQIDNQLSDCIFPVVLAPVPPPKSIADTMPLKPFFECSIVQRVVPNSNVNQYKYFSVLMQEFHFKIDLLFVTEIADMFTLAAVTDEKKAKQFNEDVESINKLLSDLVLIHSQQEQKHFYDNLHLGPIKMHLSFSMAGSDISALPGILSTIVQGVGVTLTDINDVVLRLAYFEQEFKFYTQNQLLAEIITHYTGQGLKQLYVLVLGLDVLGNPFGLVVGIKKGVGDLFYEPFQGAIQGPGEFAEGLVLGVKSLFGHTVGGAAGAFSKITGAFGKGLAALTFDEEYQKERRKTMNKRPENISAGLAQGGRGVLMGVYEGVSGVVTKPIAGAREGGVGGFFKGLGRGAIGLVARPGAGVVDFASTSLDAVRRAADGSDDAARMRPPRFLPTDNILRPYSRPEASGNKLLREIEKGKYADTDTFVYSTMVVENQEIFIISNHRILYIAKSDLFGYWTIHWTYMWNEIADVASVDQGVQITLNLKDVRKSFYNLRKSSSEIRKIVFIPQKTKRDHIVELIENLRSEA